MSTIRVRRLDENWDPVYGNGQKDYLFDQDAILQIIQSWLRLWFAEWWENQTAGLPMTQQILGKMGTNKKLADRLIQKRIAQTVYVKRIVSFESNLVSSTREYECQATVETEFGLLTVTNGG